MTPCYYWFPSIQIYSNRRIINKYTKYVQNICSVQCICLLQVTFRHKVKSQFGKLGDDCSTASRFLIREEDLTVPVWKSEEMRNIQNSWDALPSAFDSRLDVVRCSEVAHGVRRVCQTGMKSKMHGLWVRHDSRRLLFFSPPQTRCLRVQIPLSDLLFQAEDHRHSLVEDQQLGLRLLTLQV